MKLFGRIIVMSLALGVGLSVAPANADQMYGPFLVQGRIESAYTQSGGSAKWGNPTIPESPSARGGRFQTFAKDTSFYWHPLVDRGTAHQVGGAIRAKWAELGWEYGALRYPTSDEKTTTAGWFGSSWVSSTFEGGQIYWSASTGAHQVWGEIQRKYLAEGGAGGRFGLPIADEVEVAPGVFAQNFKNGQIHWP
ncbi:MAG: LGFP repeat-containing protein [Mycobacteriaceae bacterium]